MLYKERNLIERFFNKLKQFRAIATRYDKTARNFLAAIQFVAATILLNCRKALVKKKTSWRREENWNPTFSRGFALRFTTL